MQKIVPDPPAFTFQKTASRPYGACDAGLQPMFTVRAGVDTESALTHLSLLLKCATESAYEMCDNADLKEKGLLWSTLHSIEQGQAIVEALLEGAEAIEHPIDA